MNQAVTGSKHRYKDIWQFCKQIWYIPFIWSLAWFSYWIGHSFFVNHLLLTQIDSLYYYGVTVSIAFLLIAGYTSGKSKNKTVLKKIKVASSIKKEFSLHKSFDENKDQTQYLNQDFVDRTKIEKAEPKPQINHQSLIETFQLEKPWERSEKLPQEPMHIDATPHTSSSQVNHSDQTRKSQKTPSDCLVCPNLVNCPQRQKRIFNPETPCPFAKELNKNSLEYDRNHY